MNNAYDECPFPSNGKLPRPIVESLHSRNGDALSLRDAGTYSRESESSEPLSPLSPLSDSAGPGTIPAPPEYLLAVYRAAMQKPLPEAARRYYLPGLQKLVALCYELQVAAAAEGTLFLACRDAGSLLGEGYRRVSRWIRKLEVDGVLQRVATGSRARRKANEYRFTGQATGADPAASPEVEPPAPPEVRTHLFDDDEEGPYGRASRA